SLPTRFHAPGSSFLPASEARVRSRSLATHARLPHRPLVNCQPQASSILLQPARTLDSHDRVATLRVLLENSAPQSGCTFPSRMRVGPGPSNSLDHAASPPPRALARNCTHR